MAGAGLVADQQAANATYDYLIDLINLQRVVGVLGLILSPEEQRTWIQKLEGHMKRAGIEPDRG